MFSLAAKTYRHFGRTSTIYSSTTMEWQGQCTGREHHSTSVPQSALHDPIKRSSGTRWAEDMDILDSILEEEPSNTAHAVEVMPCTEMCIKASFCSMSNMGWRSLCSNFITPKGADYGRPMAGQVVFKETSRQITCAPDNDTD